MDMSVWYADYSMPGVVRILTTGTGGIRLVADHLTMADAQFIITARHEWLAAETTRQLTKEKSNG